MNIDYFSMCLDLEDSICQLDFMPKIALPDQTFIPEDVNSKKILSLAKNGDREAQYCLSRMYDNGVGVENNFGKRLLWLEKAAMNGHADALTTLAGLRLQKESGDGFQNEEIRDMFRQAYELGSIDALYDLGLMEVISDMQNNKKDSTGIDKIRQAAEMGHSRAEYLLGQLYTLGMFVKKNKEKALEYLHRADEKCCQEAASYLGLAYHSGELGLKKDKKKAFCYLSKALRGPFKSKNFRGNFLLMLYLLDGKTHDIDYYWAESIRNDLPDIPAVMLGLPLLVVLFDRNNRFAKKDKDSIKDAISAYSWELFSNNVQVKKKAKKALEVYAKGGNQSAICELANYSIREYGRIEKDEVLYTQLQKIALNGNSEAQYLFGLNCRDTGFCLKESFEWFEKSAEQDCPYACATLAEYYSTNTPSWLNRDYEKAVKYINRAIEIEEKDEKFIYGLGDNYFLLGCLYLEGKGVKKDEKKAYELFNEGALFFSDQCVFKLITMYEKGIYVKKDMKYAFNLLRSAFYRDNYVYGTRLAQYYIDGKVIKRDIEAAVGILHQMMKDGYTSCYLELAKIHFAGFSPDRTPSEGAKMLKKIEYSQDMYVHFVLGLMHDYGYFKAKDSKAAFHKYTLSAHYGFSDAKVNLSYMYLFGNGIERDVDMAFKLCSEAANDGNPIAQYNLGLLYKEGIGVERDKNIAKNWFSLAAEQGDTQAKSEIESNQESSTPIDDLYRRIKSFDYLDFEKLANGTYTFPSEDDPIEFHPIFFKTDFLIADKVVKTTGSIEIHQISFNPNFHFGSKDEMKDFMDKSMEISNQYYTYINDNGLREEKITSSGEHHTKGGLIEDVLNNLKPHESGTNKQKKSKRKKKGKH